MRQSGSRSLRPFPSPGTIGGIVTDVNDDIIPGADVSLESLNAGDRRSTTSDDNGSFAFDGLKAGVPYQVTIRANGFVAWASDTFFVNPGQFLFLKSSTHFGAHSSVKGTVGGGSQTIPA
jgi:Carboxypeptidase regulatory-like domain